MFQVANDLIESSIANRLYSGAALAVIRHGETIFSAYYGKVDFSQDAAPVDADTRFDLASISKIFSTTSIALRFIDRGLIRLDDRVADFFPEAETSAQIRVRHLLTHTSGQPPHFFLEKEWDKVAPLYKVFMQRPLAHEVGTFEAYSCMGYILLGEILKKASGKTMDQLFHEEVRVPLGLENVSYGPLDISKTKVAKTMDLRTKALLEGVVHDENARYQGGVSANAGLFSNLGDLCQLAKVLLAGGRIPRSEEYFLSPTILQAARRNYTSGLDEDRGLGFFLGSTQGSSFGDLIGLDSFGHTGFTGTSLIVSPSLDTAVVFLCNRVLADLEDGGNIVRMRALMHNSIAAEVSELE